MHAGRRRRNNTQTDETRSGEGRKTEGVVVVQGKGHMAGEVHGSQDDAITTTTVTNGDGQEARRRRVVQRAAAAGEVVVGCIE